MVDREEDKGLRLDFHFSNQGHPIVPVARKELPGKVNHLRGSNEKEWLTNIPTFEEVVYQDIWPGIDLYFFGREGQLKYEFFVQPGASIDTIKFAYRGMDGLSIDDDGNIILQTMFGEMMDKRPRNMNAIVMVASFNVTQVTRALFKNPLIS
ncbi:hypothetical protein QTG56_10960 [Rossellomorea sp. AcN35-11]|nr:hypothetical protein [Rossellomorea aquimaris]WJV31394.1 hypothetical protein QTG56_10960 [Rossellomorea sp. AcN35-11]